MVLTKRWLRREHRAMQSHLELLRGLLLLIELRISEHDAAKQELGIVDFEDRESLYSLRMLLRYKYMPGETKARMILDEYQEIDMYVTGPLELFFCVAQAMVDRYRLNTEKYSTLTNHGLDQYLITNAPAFDAVKNLRDWLLHPGFSRQTDKAASMFWDDNGELVADHPYAIVVRLVILFEEVVKELDELSRRN